MTPTIDTRSPMRSPASSSSAMGLRTPLTAKPISPSSESVQLVPRSHTTSRHSTDNCSITWPLSPVDCEPADEAVGPEYTSLIQSVKKDLKTARLGIIVSEIVDVGQDVPSLSRSPSPSPFFSLPTPYASAPTLKRGRRRLSIFTESDSSDSDPFIDRKPRKRGRRGVSRSSEPSPTSNKYGTKRKRGRASSPRETSDRSNLNDCSLAPKRLRFRKQPESESEFEKAVESGSESCGTAQRDSSVEIMDEPIIKYFEVTTPRRPPNLYDDSAWGTDFS